MIGENNIIQRSKTDSGLIEIPHINEKASNMRMFHWHTYYEISVVESGYGVYEIEDKIFDIEAGDIIIINDVERHRVHYEESRPLYETVIHFETNLFSGLREAGANLFDYNSMLFRNKLEVNADTRARLLRLIGQIIEEYQGKRRYYTSMMETLLYTFLLELMRDADSTYVNYQSSVGRSQNTRRMEQILKYLSGMHGPEVTLTSVATRFYMSPAYLSGFFKRMMGVNFTQYLREVRVSHALMLMKTKQMPLLDIVYESGFSSSSAFYCAFSSVYGMPPQQYMKQYKALGK